MQTRVIVTESSNSHCCLTSNSCALSTPFMEFELVQVQIFHDRPQGLSRLAQKRELRESFTVSTCLFCSVG